MFFILILFLILFFVFCAQAKHSSAGNTSWGIDGEKGTIVDMEELGVWDPYAVKSQTYKTAMEVRIQLRTINRY